MPRRLLRKERPCSVHRVVRRLGYGQFSFCQEIAPHLHFLRSGSASKSACGKPKAHLQDHGPAPPSASSFFVGKSGAPETIRTSGLVLRRHTLYPAELRARGRTTFHIVTRKLGFWCRETETEISLWLSP